nr:unnamed protein product [Callosobruchus chinensis]
MFTDMIGNLNHLVCQRVGMFF